MLKSFSQDDRDHMVEDGAISVTCEFCSANYRFAPEEVRGAADARLRRELAVACRIAIAALTRCCRRRRPRRTGQACPAPLAGATGWSSSPPTA